MIPHYIRCAPSLADLTNRQIGTQLDPYSFFTDNTNAIVATRIGCGRVNLAVVAILEYVIRTRRY